MILTMCNYLLADSKVFDYYCCISVYGRTFIYLFFAFN